MGTFISVIRGDTTATIQAHYDHDRSNQAPDGRTLVEEILNQTASGRVLFLITSTTHRGFSMKLAVLLALFSSGGFLLIGLLTGVWKYWHMMGNDEGTAPTYVNVAHRAALLYSFASLVIYEFAQRSPFSTTVNLIAVVAPILFFAIAVGSYITHGLLGDTDNQFRDSGILNPTVLRGSMWALIVAEIGGFSVLFIGVILTLV